MKRLLVLLALLTVSLAALAQVVFDHTSWEFHRPDGPTLYIEIMPNGALLLYEEDAQEGYKKFVGKRFVMCSAE